MAVAGVVLFALPAGAAITSTSGAVVQIAPPPSVLFGALQSDDHMFAFDEQQNVTLAAALPVDISQPGQYGPNCGCDPLTPGTIPAGTIVSSQFVHADPVGNRKPATLLDATIVTSTPIIGIEVCGPAKPSVCGGNKGLDDSDAVLGAPGTLYPTGDFGRGMNFDTQNDFLVWMIDNHTVEIQTSTALHVDQVRIITAGSPPPPPKATIVVKKVTVPSGDPAQFSFSGDLAGSIGDGGTISKQVDAGTYSTTEAVPAGWSLTSINCDDAGSSGNLGTATATYHVAAGQTVTCTYTDTKAATIVVKKLTVPSGAPTKFAFTGDASGSIGDGQSITVGNLKPGTYTSTEQVPAGWKLSSIGCDNAGSSGNLGTATATFNVIAGQTVTCTFTDTSNEKIGSQGLTPGYWKQPQHLAAWTIYKPTDTFDAVFNVSAFPSSLTLLQALAQGGGGVNALGRQAVAALLNATSPSIDYPLYSWQVIQLVHDAITGGNAATIEALKNQLEADNTLSG